MNLKNHHDLNANLIVYQGVNPMMTLCYLDDNEWSLQITGKSEPIIVKEYELQRTLDTMGKVDSRSLSPVFTLFEATLVPW